MTSYEQPSSLVKFARKLSVVVVADVADVVVSLSHLITAKLDSSLCGPPTTRPEAALCTALRLSVCLTACHVRACNSIHSVRMTTVNGRAILGKMAKVKIIKVQAQSQNSP